MGGGGGGGQGGGGGRGLLAEEEGEEGEEDIMLQREADSGGMVRDEVAVAAAGEAGLLDEVGDEALFDEDEDIPDE